MPTQTATPSKRQRAKTDPTELALIHSLRRVLRSRTNAEKLRQFLWELNSVLTTAHIAQALDRIEKQQAKAPEVARES
jgi:hypothetical protein